MSIRKSLGWLHYKFKSMSNKAVPDRIKIHKGRCGAIRGVQSAGKEANEVADKGSRKAVDGTRRKSTMYVWYDDVK